MKDERVLKAKINAKGCKFLSCRMEVMMIISL